jgi:hypothetical protein
MRISYLVHRVLPFIRGEEKEMLILKSYDTGKKSSSRFEHTFAGLRLANTYGTPSYQNESRAIHTPLSLDKPVDVEIK